MTYPFAILVGKRAQVKQGGVPMIPIQRWVDLYPNVHPSRTTNRFFRRYCGGVCIFGGLVMGRVMSDSSIMSNEYYTRPDLKPVAAMVVG